MDCHYCPDPIIDGQALDHDDDGNIYHYNCGMILRAKWDDQRQEDMVEEEPT